jgi:hypothetical protein
MGEGKSMKKLQTLAIILILANAFASGAVSLKLKGGLAFLPMAEYNDGLKGGYDYLAKTLGSPSGDFRSMQLGADFGGEILLSLGGGLSLGLGAGYLRMTRESTFGYEWTVFAAQETLTPQVTVIPLVLNLHRVVPLGDSLRLDLYAGAGYYLADLHQEFRTSTNFFEFSESQTFQARGGAFGGQGGIALEFLLGNHAAFFVQAEGRYAALGDVHGDTTEQGSWFLGDWTGGQGKAYLWAYSLTDAGTTYPQIAVSLFPPAGTGITNVRKARIDLSGVSLAAGIKIEF